MHVAGAQLCSQTVGQRVVAGGLEVAVERAVLLLPVHRDLRRVRIQHDTVRGIDVFMPVESWV